MARVPCETARVMGGLSPSLASRRGRIPVMHVITAALPALRLVVSLTAIPSVRPRHDTMRL